MSVYRVARRYAEAALELAEEQKQGDRLASDLEVVAGAVKASREFAAFLKSPVIPREKKRGVLMELFRKKLSPFSFSVLNLVLDKGREDVLEDIIAEFFRLRDERLGIVTLEIRAAAELSAAQQKAIVKRFETLTKKKVRVAYSVDEQLKGGFVARVGDTVYDGSVRRQLELLRERFAEGVGRN